MTHEIDAVMQKNQQVCQRTELELAKDYHQNVAAAITATRKETTMLDSNLSTARGSLESRRRAIKSGLQEHTRTREQIDSTRSGLENKRENHSATIDAIHSQRRRLTWDVHSIYSIEPNNSSQVHPLTFSIRGLYFPNSDFNSPKLSASAISAALGYAAHATQLLGSYLHIALPYPITPRSSTSTINDSISLFPPSQSRSFPLYLNARADDLSNASGSAAFGRFEYGVFLLNKDIEAVSARLGVRVLDVRQTLPNLKYCFLVATAGKGELPKRLTGPRGLLKAAVGIGSQQSSRRGSDDSNGVVESEVRRRLASGREESGLARSAGTQQ